jgi:hypothetical protein
MYTDGAVAPREGQFHVQLLNEDLEEAVKAATAVRGDSIDAIVQTVHAKLRSRLLERTSWSVAEAFGPLSTESFDSLITEIVYSDDFEHVLDEGTRVAAQIALDKRQDRPTTAWQRKGTRR